MNLAKALAAWGEDAPAWVRSLAAACDRTSQAEAAARVGISGAVVSRVINRSYGARYDEVETLVRAALGGEAVRCPAIGDTIPLAGCVRNRRRDGPARNHLQQLFARTCPRCPLNTDTPGEIA